MFCSFCIPLVTETGVFSRIKTAPRLEIIQELETRTMSKTMCLHTQKEFFLKTYMFYKQILVFKGMKCLNYLFILIHQTISIKYVDQNFANLQYTYTSFCI